MVPRLEFELLSSFDSVCHGLTTRAGGVSEPPYEELNLGLHVGDHPVRVIENRRRACAELGVEFERCTFAQQVHGEAVSLVEEGQAGAGRTRFEQGIPAADGLLVKAPGVTVAVIVADCVPMVIYDPEHHVGAVVHAGWAGTTAAIAAKAVARLTEEGGSRPAALVVGPACREAVRTLLFEVGSPRQLSELAWVHESLPAAWDYIGRKLRAAQQEDAPDEARKENGA